jgi:hypothetical protein
VTRAALFLFAALAVHGAAAADFNITTLFDTLARNRPDRAAFSEKKYIAILDAPVESSGEIAFIPPDRLEKVTLKPRLERYVIDRDTASVERAGKTLTLRLRENPAIAVMIESIRGTLAGDLALLTRSYSVGLQGDARAWRMILRPLDPSLATIAERIEIAGSQARVTTVEIFQVDGDRSVMTLSPLAR